MASETAAEGAAPEELVWHGRGLTDVAVIACASVAAYVGAALVSFSPADPGWSYTGSAAPAANLMGTSGAWLADVLLMIAGNIAFVLPLCLAAYAAVVFKNRRLLLPANPRMLGVATLGLLLLLFAATGLATLHFHSTLAVGAGGIIGWELAESLVPALNVEGTTLVLLAAGMIGFSLFTGVSWFELVDGTGRYARLAAAAVRHHALRLYDQWRDRREAQAQAEAREVRVVAHVERQKQREPVQIAPPPKAIKPSTRAIAEKQQPLFEPVGELPHISLLDENTEIGAAGYSEETLETLSRLLELKLRDFGVEAEVVAVHPGPVITRFEIQPAPGVKVSKISGLVKDLARSLAVFSVRVVEVIPGKSVVGIEIPNENREVVRLSEVVASDAYDKASSPLTLALGKDIGGHPVIVDLARMPHLLVAGTTGSGKSVGVNAMLLSLLLKSGPEQVRLILVDPKMLELSVYEGIPHLLTPVVTDMKEAANALRWCVAEMERRYRLLAEFGVRNLAGFNRKAADAIAAGEPLTDPFWSDDNPDPAPNLEPLPLIVVVIDEFADMMMVVGKKVEELIARIAQKARAAGIHLVLATQRPSVDVITGLIKANIPTRISFQVSSKVDSRTVLDQQGAEQLLGHGDMLYLPPGTAHPVRVHGAFVSDEEVHRVVEDWKARSEPDYMDEILDGDLEAAAPIPGIDKPARDDNAEECDPLYDEAVAFVIESRRASISSVQRQLRIGYNRAARMIEAMEAAGVVSPMATNGNREVLVPNRGDG